MKGNAAKWDNPDAGRHPLPEDPLEIAACLRAAERCMQRFPYLGLRFGARGDAFARTDSGFLVTLTRFPVEYVLAQVQWLVRVLSNRGMPGLLMEAHLEILAAELTASLPANAAAHRKLADAARVLTAQREAVLAADTFRALAARHEPAVSGTLPNFAGLVLSAVCDEACGIASAVQSILDWAASWERGTPAWRQAVEELVHAGWKAAHAERGSMPS